MPGEAHVLEAGAGGGTFGRNSPAARPSTLTRTAPSSHGAMFVGSLPERSFDGLKESVVRK